MLRKIKTIICFICGGFVLAFLTYLNGFKNGKEKTEYKIIKSNLKKKKEMANVKKNYPLDDIKRMYKNGNF